MKSKIPASLRVIGRSVVDWWDGWLDMVLVTAVWFFAQLTIVLGPPATFGMYYVVHNMVNGEALGVKGLIQGARKYFWKSLAWGLINLVVIGTIVINFQFYGSIEAIWGFYLQVVIASLAVLWASTNFYALPFFFEQEVKKLRVALRNGVLTSMATPFYTFVLMIFVALILVLSVGFIIPTFLGLPGLIPMIGFRAVNDRLIAFKIRQPELTPKEIEMAESGRTEVEGLNYVPGEGSDLANRRAASDDVPDEEGKIE